MKQLSMSEIIEHDVETNRTTPPQLPTPMAPPPSPEAIRTLPPLFILGVSGPNFWPPEARSPEFRGLDLNNDESPTAV